jgi:hypothetical protein
MLNVNDHKNIEMYVKETWKAELKVTYDKDFVDDFQFSEYCNKITKKGKENAAHRPANFPNRPYLPGLLRVNSVPHSGRHPALRVLDRRRGTDLDGHLVKLYIQEKGTRK